MELVETDPGKIDADIVFSALPAEAARKLEPEFARTGFTVVSKASAFRLDEKVLLVVPEINPEHLELVESQRREWSGVLVTDPNCTTTILALPLKPLHDAYRVRRVVVTTLQAASGAGYPGVPSLDLIDNVVPHITGEEEKLKDDTGGRDVRRLPVSSYRSNRGSAGDSDSPSRFYDGTNIGSPFCLPEIREKNVVEDSP